MRYSKLLLLLAAVAATLALVACGKDPVSPRPPDPPEPSPEPTPALQVKLLTEIDMPYSAHQVQVLSNQAYVLGHVLQIVDISDKTSPHILSQVGNGGFCYDFTVTDGSVLMTNCVGGWVIDVRDPSNPTSHRGFAPVNIRAYGIATDGNNTVIGHMDQIAIFDNSAQYSLVSTMTTGRLTDVEYSEGVFYLLSESGAFGISLANPDCPTRVGANISGSVSALDARGDHIFYTVADSGLYICGRSSARIIGHCDTPGEAQGVVVSGDYAFVADGDAGLQVVDISDVSAPRIVGSYSRDNLRVNDVDRDGEHVFLVGSYQTSGGMNFCMAILEVDLQ